MLHHVAGLVHSVKHHSDAGARPLAKCVGDLCRCHWFAEIDQSADDGAFDSAPRSGCTDAIVEDNFDVDPLGKRWSTVFVDRGYGEVLRDRPDAVCKGLAEAAEIILSRDRQALAGGAR